MIYLDYAATAPLSKEALASMMPFLTENFANPSGLYAPANAARHAVREAGRELAALFGCLPTEVFFTGSGTESDNLALRGTALREKSQGNHIITSAIEHPAVLNTCKSLEKEGFKVTYLEPDETGLISPDSLKRALTKSTVLVSIMMANNEVGSLEPIKELCKIAHEAGALFHTDAVQAAGQLNIDVKDLQVDMLSCSAHKLGGPKGVGMLYKRENLMLSPIIFGGGQERGLRSGTENVAGIVGFGRAAREARERLAEGADRKLAALRDYFLEKLLSENENVYLNGSKDHRLPGNISLAIPGAEAETLLVLLNAEGVCASGGSACSSRSNEPSHVLTAMKRPANYIRGTLRLTLGHESTKEEVEEAAGIIKKTIEKARSFQL